MKSYAIAGALMSLAQFSMSSQSLAASCTPISGATDPVIISSPGRYCLSRDIVSRAGNGGILIQADNVTVDFAGHTLSNAASVATLPGVGLDFGVDASYNQTITIMNGTIKGFTDGIVLGERVTFPILGNYNVSNMKILGIQSLGRAVGIYEARGSNVTLVNNVISGVTGGIPGQTSGDAIGLMIYGATLSPSPAGKIIIKGNQVDHVTATKGGGDAQGILVDGDNEIVITGNTVKEISVVRMQNQSAYGIKVADISEGLVEIADNYVWNSTPASNSIGIRLGVSSNQGSSVVRDSVVGGFNTGISLFGACTPYYLYNTVSNAAISYEVTGTTGSCIQGTQGPGNQ
jgi:hypothetical protein